MNRLILAALFILHPSAFILSAEPLTAPILRIEAGMHTATIRRISADRAGRLVLTASDDKTARLWSAAPHSDVEKRGANGTTDATSESRATLLRVLRPPLGEGN